LALRHEGASVTLETDPRRVRQILLNLLSNAIKFGEGNPITVTCRPLEEGGVEVDVTDRGRGIEPENLDRIFDEFVQIAHPDQALGTGLGLPISRRLAVLLGGTLNVESALGEGSTFRLVLPPKLDIRAVVAESLPLPTATDDPLQEPVRPRPRRAAASDDDDAEDAEPSPAARRRSSAAARRAEAAADAADSDADEAESDEAAADKAVGEPAGAEAEADAGEAARGDQASPEAGHADAAGPASQAGDATEPDDQEEPAPVRMAG
ncbi:MAG TPA: ATP-binding protein, partial [Longimicrobium sp.]|nr:ATP-binding protein [Longimicrobium sp.]